MTSFDKLITETDANIVFFTDKLVSLKTKYDQRDYLLQFSGLIAITILDLSVEVKNMCKAQTDWEKIFFIRNTYLTIHESAKKIKPENGISLIQELLNSKYPELKDQYQDILNDIDSFRSRADYRTIKRMRNFNAAHIESCFTKYYETAFSSDVQEAAGLCIDYMKILLNANKIAVALEKKHSCS